MMQYTHHDRLSGRDRDGYDDDRDYHELRDKKEEMEQRDREYRKRRDHTESSKFRELR